MKPLSERLLDAANESASNLDGYEHLLSEAAEFAERVESSPLAHYDTYHVYSPNYPSKMTDGDFVAWMVSMKQLNGQRVRIVLDKEG